MGVKDVGETWWQPSNEGLYPQWFVNGQYWFRSLVLLLQLIFGCLTDLKSPFIYNFSRFLGKHSTAIHNVYKISKHPLIPFHPTLFCKACCCGRIGTALCRSWRWHATSWLQSCFFKSHPLNMTYPPQPMKGMNRHIWDHGMGWHVRTKRLNNGGCFYPNGNPCGSVSTVCQATGQWLTGDRVCGVNASC